MARHKKIRYDVTIANAGSNSLGLLPANNTRLVMEEIAIPSRESMHTDEHELYFDEISHEACRVTDFVEIQRVFVSMHAF